MPYALSFMAASPRNAFLECVNPVIDVLPEYFLIDVGPMLVPVALEINPKLSQSVTAYSDKRPFVTAHNPKALAKLICYLIPYFLDLAVVICV
jgi:hypothetical protein